MTWSLAVEEQFYLTLPLIVRYVERRKLLPAMIGLILGSVLLRILLIFWFPTNAPMANHVLMPCRADALGLGVLSAILVRDRRLWTYLVAHRKMLYASSAILFFGILLIAMRSYPVFTAALYGFQYLVLALFYTSLLLLAVTGNDRFVRIAFCNRPLMMLGGIAYGTYLFHEISLDAFHAVLISSHVTLNTATTVGTTVASLIATIGLATLSWRLFEKPLVRRGHAYTY